MILIALLNLVDCVLLHLLELLALNQFLNLVSHDFFLGSLRVQSWQLGIL